MACDHAQYEHYFLIVGDSMNGPWLSYLHVAALLSCVDRFLRKRTDDFVFLYGASCSRRVA